MKKSLIYDCPRCTKKYKTVRHFRKFLHTCNNCALEFGVVTTNTSATVVAVDMPYIEPLAKELSNLVFGDN